MLEINFHRGGWVAGLLKNKAISASNYVEGEVEAVLGKMCCQKVFGQQNWCTEKV